MISPWYMRWSESPYVRVSVITVTLVLAYVITHCFGGSSTSFPHIFYIPITVAAYCYRYHGGILVGLVAGILCGPFMPSVTDPLTAQSLENWLLRMSFFTLIGFLMGVLSHLLYERLTALRTLNIETILAFVKAVDAKDPYTADHSTRVSNYAVTIGETMGLPAPDIERVKWTALLHDIGKIGIPEEVLRKPRDLSPQEWEMIRRHPIYGEAIVKGIDSYRPFIPGIRHHHERMDGQGYPDGLRGDAISLDARIVAVADALEAMTASRPYRVALGLDQAVERIRAGAGTQFDPQVVQALEQAVREKPWLFEGDHSAVS